MKLLEAALLVLVSFFPSIGIERLTNAFGVPEKPRLVVASLVPILTILATIVMFFLIK